MTETAEAFTYDPGNPENTTFTEAGLNGAVLSVNSKKMSIQDAATTFQVPILTLWNKVLNIKIEEMEEEILTKQEESKVARIMREATDYGCHPSVDDLLYTVKSILEEKGQFFTLKHKLGNDWILGFLDRHRGITLKPSENLKNLPGVCSKSSKMVLLDEKNVFLDCSIKKERLGEGSDETASPEEALQKALVEVKLHGMNVFASAKLHNVSPATLWDEVCGKDATSMSKQGSSSTALNAEEEAEIADMLRKAIAKGLEVTRNDLRETVKAVLDSKGRTTRFVNNKPSKWWVPSFLSRHPGIILKEFSCRPSSIKRTSDTAQASGGEPPATVPDCALSSTSPATDNNKPSSAKPSSKSSTASSVTSLRDVNSTASRNLQDGKYPNAHTSSALSQAVTTANDHAVHSAFLTSSNSSSSKSQVSECNTVTPSTSVISNVSTITSSTTMSHTDPLSAHRISNGSVEIGHRRPALLEIGDSHSRMGPLLSTATQDSCGKSQSDSTFSLLKRLSMINFSLGEDRVLKFFSYLDRGDKMEDMDYYYWKSLIYRIIPSHRMTLSSAPAFHQESQSHFNPSNTAYGSAHSLDGFSSQPLLPLPRSYESQAGTYNNNNNNQYNNNHYNNNNNYYRHHNKHPRFYKNRNYQTRYHGRRTDAVDPNTEPQEAADGTGKEKEEKGEDEEKDEVKKRKKDKNDTGPKGKSHDEPDERQAKTGKNPKKKRKVERDDTDVEENDVTEESNSKTSVKKQLKNKKSKKEKEKSKKEKEKETKKEKEKKKKLKEKETKKEKEKSSKTENKSKKGKEKLVSVRDEEDEEEMNKKKKKKKKERRKAEKENPLIRVEVDMKRANKRTVFTDSSSED